MEGFKNQDGRVADLPAPKEASASPHFSLAQALEVVECDHLLLREMAQSFLRYAPVLLERAKEGLERGDVLQVGRNLRDLEERAASVGALSFREGVLEILQALRSGGLSAPSSPLEKLPLLLAAFRDSVDRTDWEELDDGFPA